MVELEKGTIIKINMKENKNITAFKCSSCGALFDIRAYIKEDYNSDEYSVWSQIPTYCYLCGSIISSEDGKNSSKDKIITLEINEDINRKWFVKTTIEGKYDCKYISQIYLYKTPADCYFGELQSKIEDLYGKGNKFKDNNGNINNIIWMLNTEEKISEIKQKIFDIQGAIYD